jgi:hypothetical protein
MKVQTAVQTALRILIVAAIFYFSARTIVDPDLWWHLKCGIDICQLQKIALVDPYSFLSFDQKWINHEWLSETILGFIFLHFGWTGLIVFKSTIAMTTLFLIYKWLKHWQLDDFGMGMFLLLTAIFLSPATTVLRPHNISCLLFTIVLLLIRGSGSHPMRMWWLPLIFLFWINVHGGFIVGLAALFAWLFFKTFFGLISRSQAEKPPAYFWLILLSCLAALVVNPYGMELPQFIFQVSTMARPDISEWLPLRLLYDHGPAWALVFVVGIASICLSKKPKDPSLILMWLLFAFAPLLAVRHVQFFGIATTVLIGEHLVDLWQARQSATRTSDKWAVPDIIFVGASLITACLLFVFGIKFFVPPDFVATDDVPEGQAIALLKRAGAHGNMVVDFDWGGYAIWHLAPNVKVSFDGRREFVYSERATLANRVFTLGLGPWDAILQKFPVDIVLVKKDSPAFNLMKGKSDWTLTYEDDNCALFFPRQSEQGRQVYELLQQIPPERRGQVLKPALF